MTLTISNTLYFDAYMKGARSSKFNKWKNACLEILSDEEFTQHRIAIGYEYPIRYSYYQYFGRRSQEY